MFIYMIPCGPLLNAQMFLVYFITSASHSSRLHCPLIAKGFKQVGCTTDHICLQLELSPFPGKRYLHQLA